MLTKKTKSLTMILLAFVMALTLCLGFSGFSGNTKQGVEAATVLTATQTSKMLKNGVSAYDDSVANTKTWNFGLITTGSSQKYSGTSVDEGGIILAGGSNIQIASSGGLSCKGASSIYIPAEGAGKISMTTYSTSNRRWFDLYVDGVAVEGKRLWSKPNATADGSKGPQEFEYTASDLTTVTLNGVDGTYLWLKDNNTELKVATFTVVTTAPAHEHSYGAPEYSWDGVNCTATMTCDNTDGACDAVTVTEIKTGTLTSTTPATCSATGLEVYTATFDNTAFTAQTTEVVLPIDPDAHKFSDPVATKEPTCSETGLQTGTCDLCGATAEQVIDKLPHTEVIDEAVAPTCSETGLTEGKHCSVCNEVIVAQTVVSATGLHTWEDVEGTNTATCTEAGTKQQECSVCGETQTVAAPALGHNIVDGECTVCGSTLVSVNWNGVDYAEAGSNNWLGGTVSAATNNATDKTFDLGNGVSVIALGGNSAVDYKSGNPDGVNYMIKNGQYSGTAWSTNDPSTPFITIKVPAGATIKITASNYSSNSSKRYCALKLNGVTVNQSTSDTNSLASQSVFTFTVDAAGSYDLYNVQNGSKTVGLVYVSKIEVEFFKPISSITLGTIETVYNAQVGDTTISLPAQISYTGDETGNLDIAWNESEIAAALATAGTHTVTGIVTAPAGCRFDGTKLTETISVTVNTTEKTHEHVWDSGTVITPSTCQTQGVIRYTCTYSDENGACGATYDADLPLADHTDEVITGKPATCTESGLTDGARCSVCGEITLEQQVIEALGHDFVDDVCSRCGLRQYIHTVNFDIFSDTNQSPATSKALTATFDATSSATNYFEGTYATYGAYLEANGITAYSSVNFESGNGAQFNGIKLASNGYIEFTVKNDATVYFYKGKSTALTITGISENFATAGKQSFSATAGTTYRITANGATEFISYIMIDDGASELYIADGVATEQTFIANNNANFIGWTNGSQMFQAGAAAENSADNKHLAVYKAVYATLTADSGAGVYMTEDSTNLGLRFTFSLALEGIDLSALDTKEAKDTFLATLFTGETNTVTMFAYTGEGYKAATKNISTVSFAENNVIRISVVVIGIDRDADKDTWYDTYKYSAKVNVQLCGVNKEADNFTLVGDGYTLKETAQAQADAGNLSEAEKTAYGVA